MNQFYSDHIVDGEAILSATETRHLKVLRKRPGDLIKLVDGKGSAYSSELISMDKDGAKAQIIRHDQRVESPPLLSIGISPTKSNDRFEWFLEKAVEIGVGHIFPLISVHSERKVIKIERLQKIALSAMKQSMRLWLPVIHPIQKIDQFLGSESFQEYDKFIPNTKEKSVALKDAVNPMNRTLVLIGPEGGFSDSEIVKALDNGFKSVRMGPYRLRTETAGIVACAIFANS